MGKEPKTYWEYRCSITENVVDALMTLIGSHIPYARDNIDAISNEWTKQINSIELELCEHEWVSADNKVVSGALICTKCNKVKAIGD